VLDSKKQSNKHKQQADSSSRVKDNAFEAISAHARPEGSLACHFTAHGAGLASDRVSA
jgi:hypothetical protein